MSNTVGYQQSVVVAVNDSGMDPLSELATALGNELNRAVGILNRAKPQEWKSMTWVVIDTETKYFRDSSTRIMTITATCELRSQT